jgi:hypothetical protein
MFALVYILIQEQHDINLLFLPNDSLHDVMNLLYLKGYVNEYQVTIGLRNIYIDCYLCQCLVELSTLLIQI